MPRRRTGVLLPLELRILETGLHLQTPDDGFHGFLLASEMAATDDTAGLTAHGTLYKALARMTEAGLLDAAWEDPTLAEAAGRPRRRLYRVTPEGAVALAARRAETATSSLTAAKLARGLA
jgi:DNA-binding PadR family transcriptional regulator